MAIMPPSLTNGEVPAPRSLCPACGLDGDGHTIPGNTARYLCPTGLHMWSVTWFAEDGGTA